MIALAECEDGVYRVEIGDSVQEDGLAGHDPGGTVPSRPRPVELAPGWVSSLLVDVDAAGSTVVVLVDRRPPLLVSHDLGGTWSERGSGLPRGRTVVLGESPDEMLYASRNRLYVSRNGGVFWRSVAVELPEIRAAAWA